MSGGGRRSRRTHRYEDPASYASVKSDCQAAIAVLICDSGSLQHQLAHSRGIRFTLHGLHDRADYGAGGSHLPFPVLLEHVGLSSQSGVDRDHERRVISDHFEPSLWTT